MLADDPSNIVTTSLLKQVEQYVAVLPLILELANPAIKPRHWTRLFEAVNQPYDEETVFSLHQLFEYKIFSRMLLLSFLC